MPDAGISASFHYLFEVKTDRNAVCADQLQGHLSQLSPTAQLQRLYLLTPDLEPPPEVEEVGDDRLVWVSFADLDQAIGDLLKDEDERVSEREQFLLHELQRLFEADGLLTAPEDVVVVVARNAYPEYLKLSAYLCQVGRFRPGLQRIGFYTQKAIQPEFPLIIHRVPVVHLTEEEATRLETTDAEWGAQLATAIHGRIARDPSSAGIESQVFLLTSSDSDETIRLPHRVDHTHPVAWTMGHRYLRSSDIEHQPRTTDDLD